MNGLAYDNLELSYDSGSTWNIRILNFGNSEGSCIAIICEFNEAENLMNH